MVLSHRIAKVIAEKKKLQCLQMLAVALWETDDWHGRHFAPALPASIVWEIVNIWHCQTTTTHLYPCEEKASNSPSVSYIFVILFKTYSTIRHFVREMRQIKLFLWWNSVLFRRCRETAAAPVPGRQKNGSVLPLSKYLLHFQRRFQPRCFV